MDLRDKLIEAEYVHRGDDGSYLGNQCGFSCDYGTLMNNDDSPRPCYRFCQKLRIRVSDYDSCRYYTDTEFVKNCGIFVQAINCAPEKQQQPARKKSRGVYFLCIAVAIAVVVYLILR